MNLLIKIGNAMELQKLYVRFLGMANATAAAKDSKKYYHGKKK
jgi:hypothetical protein